MGLEETVALYMRISDEDEALATGAESESIAGQRLILRDFVENHPTLRNCRIAEFIDDGFSGTNFERPAFQQMLEQVKKRTVKCIIVKDFSRLGRNYLEAGNYLEQVFPFLGVRFFSVNDNFDSHKDFGAAGSIDVAFKNIIYEAYSKDLSVKIKSVKRSRAEQGKFVTAFAPYGYLKSNEDKNHLVIDEECAGTVRRIYQLFLDGISQTDIARRLNQEGVPSPLMVRKGRKERFHMVPCNSKTHWTASTIAKILTDERYTGAGIYGKVRPKTVGSKKDVKAPPEDWIIVPDAHERIIDDVVFQKVKERKRKHHYSRKEESPLARKVYCKECNHALLRKVKPQGTVLWQCTTWRHTDTYHCYQSCIKEELLEHAVLQYLQRIALLLDNQEYVKKGGGKIPKQQDQYRQVQELEERIKREELMAFTLYESYKADKISKAGFQTKLAESGQRLEQLKNKLAELKQKVEHDQQDSQMEKESDVNRLKKYEPFTELTRAVAEEFVKRINVDSNGQIEIIWNFNDDFLSVKQRD